MKDKKVKNEFKESDWASFQINEDGSKTGLVPATKQKVK